MPLPSLTPNTGAIRCYRTSISKGPVYLQLSRTFIQSHDMWRCARPSREQYKSDFEQRRADEYQRHCQSKLRRRAAHPHPHHPRPQVLYHHHRHPWWGRGWGWGWGVGWNQFKTNFPEHHQYKDIWEAEKTRTQQTIERLKREIEADPYAALFGRRLEPFHKDHDNIWANFWRSFWGLENGAGTTNATTTTKAESKNGRAAHSMTAQGASSDLEDIRKPPPLEESALPEEPDKISPQVTVASALFEYEFDPVTGRMVAKKPGAVAHEDTHEGVKGSEDDYILDVSSRKATPGGEIATDHSIVDSFEPESNILGESKDAKDGPLTPPGEPSSHEAKLDNAGKESFEMLKDEEEVAVHDQAAPESPSVNTNGFLSGRTPAELAESVTAKSVQEEEESLTKQERDEDLDLLGASDIRASYASRKVGEEPDAQKQHRLKDLDEIFDSSEDPAGQMDAESIRARFRGHSVSSPADEQVVEPIMATDMNTNQSDLQRSEGPETNSTVEDATSTLLSSDSIDTDQPSSTSSSSASTYRVLAYDSSTLKVNKAETSSSLHTPNETLHPTEVLSRLNNPAKFLTYFAEMKNDGYEIVSGGGDILVFKRVRKDGVTTEPISSASIPLAEAKRDEGFGMKSPGNEQSSVEQSTESAANEQRQAMAFEMAFEGVSPEPSPSSASGPQQGSVNASAAESPTRKQSGFRKVVRRMFLTGVATAATLYAAGVVVEYFRTGGADGRGIDGFTEFESERRRRDRG